MDLSALDLSALDVPDCLYPLLPSNNVIIMYKITAMIKATVGRIKKKVMMN